MNKTLLLKHNPLVSALKKFLFFGLIVGSIATKQVLAADATFLVQLNDYKGNEAYFSMYLVDDKGRYVRTLWVSGDNPRWYPEQPRWWKYLGRKPQELDAITGASTATGDRSVIRIKLEEEIIDAGYKIRIDTSVEDQQNYQEDVEVELASKNMKDKIPGTGYIRYLRFKWD